MTRDSPAWHLARRATAAAGCCRSLHRKRVTRHILRHRRDASADGSVDVAVIALWLGHEQIHHPDLLGSRLKLKEHASNEPARSTPTCVERAHDKVRLTCNRFHITTSSTFCGRLVEAEGVMARARNVMIVLPRPSGKASIRLLAGTW